jgi:hypothetical protein
VDTHALQTNLQCPKPLRRDFVNSAFINVATDGFSVNETILDDAHVYAPPIQPVSHAALPPRRVPFLYSTNQKWTVALLKLLDTINAPDYAFKQAVLRWARAALADGCSFQPDGGMTRRPNVERLFSMMNNATQLLPSVHKVVVPHGAPCDVITFDFVPQLLKLLQNPELMTQANLLIDVQNPLVPYSSPQGIRGDALSGQVYQEAHLRVPKLSQLFDMKKKLSVI